MFGIEKVDDPTTVMGLNFRNKLGLAAGFDKNARYLEVCDALGFGFVEVGTVTPLAQEGNPRPRLFRLPEDRALINRMGFNNRGLEYMIQKLQDFKIKFPNSSMVIGGNIGKNKITLNQNASDDYEICYRALYPYVEYFVVNVSSPNTPNLRELQDKEPLRKIFTAISKSRVEMLELHPNLPARPVLVKISPDNIDQAVTDILELITEFNLTGVVVSNTTVRRDGLNTQTKLVREIGNGGLSGKPLQKRCDELIALVRLKAPEITIIGVGGVDSGTDAELKCQAGADLVQIYTGFIYEGPKLISDCAKAMKK